MRRHVDQAAKPKNRIENEALQRDARCSESTLQEVIAENAWFVQVVGQIADTVGHGRRRRLDDIGDRVEHHLIDPENAAIELLVGVVDRQRRVAGNARARGDERRQPQRANPSDPTLNAPHALTIPLEIPRETAVLRAGPAKDLFGERQLRLVKSDQALPRRLAERPVRDYHPFATVRPIYAGARISPLDAT